MTIQELTRYNDFLFTQLELMRKKVIRTIYRGDSLQNLCEKLNVFYNQEDTSISTILERLFIVGEKSKRFYSGDENFEIDNTDDYVFEKIMKYFKDSLKDRNQNTVTFFERNLEFKNFFSNRYNKTPFLEILKRADVREKLAIRNYYLTLLHQLAGINYRNKSHFVSTSSDYNIAEKFSKSSGTKDRIILHCWQPIKMEISVARKYNLPTYTLGPYHYQKEFSILGGILPHFIAGVEFTKSKEFYTNPNIFKQDISNETFLFGLDIDQTNFEDILRLTNYKKSLVTNGIETWENSISR